MGLRMPDMVVHGLDSGSMAHGVEARVPFLDHEFVELCTRIPTRLKARGGIEKNILREALRGALPEEIRLRRKRGFGGPHERWMRQPLPPFAEDLLSERRLREKGYFDPWTVRNLLAEQREGSRKLGAILMSVLGIQLWDEIFLRGNPAVAPS
jgi:asparagine synthase (glutamine-hydrolysing)